MGEEKKYGPIWQLEQYLESKRKQQATLRREAEDKTKAAAAFDEDIAEYEAAIAAVRAAQK